MEVKLFESIEEAKNILKQREPRLVQFEGMNICIVLINDKIIAFKNECPHMGHPLHQGNMNYLGEIVCPLHTYRFSITTGDESENRCKPLQFIEVEESKTVTLVI